jgi:kinesin family member 2/24
MPQQQREWTEQKQPFVRKAMAPISQNRPLIGGNGKSAAMRKMQAAA